MIRSVFTSNQVSGSMAFVSTMIALLLLPQITVETSFAILFLGALFTVIIGSIDPLRFIVIHFVAKRLHDSEGLLMEDIKISIAGNYSKNIIDQFVSKFYIVIGLLIGILLFFFKTIPETSFSQIDLSNFPKNQLYTLFLQSILLIAIIGVIIKATDEFKEDQTTLENLTRFELYRMPLPFGYEWIEDNALRVIRLQQSLKTRRSIIKTLEQYLERNDYRSFNRAMNVEVNDLISSKTILNVKNILGPTESTEIMSFVDWLDLLINYPKQISEVHDIGANCLSAPYFHLVESMNDVALCISKYSSDLEEFRLFVKGLKEWSYLRVPNELVEATPLDPGSSTEFRTQMKVIKTKSMPFDTKHSKQVFYYIFNLFHQINQSTKYQELTGKKDPIEFIFKLDGPELQFRGVSFSTKRGNYELKFGEWMQWIINQKLRLNYLKIDFDEISIFEKVINLANSINAEITYEVIFNEIGESLISVLSKIFQEKWQDDSLVLDFPDIDDHLQKIRNSLKDIELSLIELKGEFEGFKLK